MYFEEFWKMLVLWLCAVATVFVTFAEKIFIKGPFPAKVKMFSNIQDNTLYDEK